MNRIGQHVRRYYRSLYAACGPRPKSSVPILSGKELARSLGYPPLAAALIPSSLWRQFHPCGNPLPALKPSEGDRILNLGSGVGVDALMLMLTHPLRLRLVNMDVVEAVLHEGSAGCARLLGNARRPGGSGTVQWVCGDAEKLPFKAATLDWVILNGVLNLFPSKEALLREIVRVLSPGGSLVGADLCRTQALPDYFKDELDAWAWCMSGACTEAMLEGLFAEAGFSTVSLEPAEAPDQLYRIVFACRKG